MCTLYENIIDLCEEKGVSGGKMCNDIKLSRGFLTDLKMGRKQSASAETIQRIAAYFDVSADRVLFGKEKSPVSEETEQEKEARKLFNELTDEQKRAIIAIMEQMK